MDGPPDLIPSFEKPEAERAPGEIETAVGNIANDAVEIAKLQSLNQPLAKLETTAVADEQLVNLSKTSGLIKSTIKGFILPDGNFRQQRLDPDVLNDGEKRLVFANKAREQVNFSSGEWNPQKASEDALNKILKAYDNPKILPEGKSLTLSAAQRDTLAAALPFPIFGNGGWNSDATKLSVTRVNGKVAVAAEVVDYDDAEKPNRAYGIFIPTASPARPLNGDERPGRYESVWYQAPKDVYPKADKSAMVRPHFK